MNYYSKEGEESLKLLKSSIDGLTSVEAEKRLDEYGENEITEKKSWQKTKILIDQLRSFLIYILLLAAAVSYFIGHTMDGSVILVIVLVNSAIGFSQQFKAEKAIDRLKKLIIHKSKVFRDGKLVEIESAKLVPGDIIYLDEGEKVNADLRILTSKELQSDEAILTGESLPVNKNSSILKNGTVIAKRENMLFAGTQVVRGSCKAVVVATGMNTEFGKIAGQLQDIKVQKTPMQKRLDLFSKQVGLVILGIVVLILILGMFKGAGMIDMFLTAVALAVGAIPEGLPAVLAISFAIASMEMSKKNAIIRKFPAVESLGSVTVICSDKTGTMTEEEMDVTEIFTGHSFLTKIKNKLFLGKTKVDAEKDKGISELMKTAQLCNNARFEVNGKDYDFIGDPTEQALVRIGLDLGFDKKTLTEQFPRIDEIKFDSDRKMMSVLRGKRDLMMYTKGAPERVIDNCTHELIGGRTIRMSVKRKDELLKASKKMESEALRVLGFAEKQLKNKKEFKETNLVFLGFMGMIDPPRPEIKDAVEHCKNAGIAIKMITGDSALTAEAIAKEIGIEGNSITGDELAKLSDDELFKIIHTTSVYARVNPQQKLRIVKTLQKHGETVAITGDGINDVLALKAGDIGIAMGIRGTDVTRDVADVVLADDNFASIVEGVKVGRKTYDNIKKFIKYILSVNYSEILLITTALLFGLPLPLLPLQLLWINLMTDSLPALSLIFEKGDNVMKSKPRKEKSLLGSIWKFVLLAGFVHFISSGIMFLVGIEKGYSIELVRSMVLTVGVLFELFFVYSCRSDKSLFKIGIFSSKWVNGAILISLMLQLALIYTPLGIAFNVVPIPLVMWAWIIPLSLSGLIIFEIGKLFRKEKD